MSTLQRDNDDDLIGIEKKKEEPRHKVADDKIELKFETDDEDQRMREEGFYSSCQR